MTDLNLKVRNVVLCEDVRQEKSNKYILIGVFAGDINVSELPARLPLSLYFDGYVTAAGQGNIAIRVSGPGDGSAVINAKYASSDAGPVALSTPRMDVNMECEGIFKVEFSEDNTNWKTMVEKKVRVESDLWTLAPILKPQPPAQSPTDAPETP
jgi:hypothetical protein